MLSHRSLSPRTRQRGLVAAAVVGSTLSLLVAAAGTSSAAPKPAKDPIPLGQGYMGAGYDIDSGNRAPSGHKAPSFGPASSAGGVQGIDVSHYQGSINWSSVKAAGISFSWMKATEGTSYKDPNFNANYLNSYNAGVIRGAYHFARPDVSGGAAQANYFASNGGAWSADNRTLPGVLDIEGSCYGLSQASMRTWISDFYNTYKSRTSRDIVIYTSPSWWSSCTGSWSGMSAKSPLWDAHWTTAANPTVPAGFPFWTVWQYTSTGSVSGVSGNVDRDKFNGTADRLLALANNTA
ncbi:GH25 family lysozyme [Streptomyces sp. NPDC050560]|uniref:GH25 family lysozyme n=1 Tax=Streptomyces sp. NPDC050560 TaxID=3365630 RepID=UPI00378BF2BD